MIPKSLSVSHVIQDFVWPLVTEEVFQIKCGFVCTEHDKKGNE